jgi:hypothetical protein
MRKPPLNDWPLGSLSLTDNCQVVCWWAPGRNEKVPDQFYAGGNPNLSDSVGDGQLSNNFIIAELPDSWADFLLRSHVRVDKPSCKAENTSRFYAEEPACDKFHTMLSLVDERQRSATASAVGSTFITFIDEVFY